MHSAVLFLIFNRPDTTKKVFDVIGTARPPRLYVAADGPRTDRICEPDLCQQARSIATNVDWPCEVKTLFREENLGCRRAVSGALDWFFENEEEGIVLEDDCVPHPTWFRFAEELLEKYRHDERIMCISAAHFPGQGHMMEFSYFFSRYNLCWGWASWRRSWAYYDHNMVLWPELRSSEWLLDVGMGSRCFKDYWTQIFDRAYKNEIDTWDYQWTFSCWAQNGLSILPSCNLVRNIGFGEEATHTKGANPSMDLPLEEMVFPLIHPKTVIRDSQADKWTDKNVFGISKYDFLKSKIKSLPAVRSALPAMRIARKMLK